MQFEISLSDASEVESVLGEVSVKCVCLISVAGPICDWIYRNRSKSHIGSYEIINFKDFKAL